MFVDVKNIFERLRKWNMEIKAYISDFNIQAFNFLERGK